VGAATTYQFAHTIRLPDAQRQGCTLHDLEKARLDRLQFELGSREEGSSTEYREDAPSCHIFKTLRSVIQHLQ
jgi:hypothetical protein